jgi:hypothetical protein
MVLSTTAVTATVPSRTVLSYQPYPLLTPVTMMLHQLCRLFDDVDDGGGAQAQKAMTVP